MSKTGGNVKITVKVILNVLLIVNLLKGYYKHCFFKQDIKKKSDTLLRTKTAVSYTQVYEI